ncbi:MAG: hypothetical protein AB7K09_13035 [Planctomycetota bacterium]
MNANETLILCEGFHDRAFWSGFFAHRACTRPSGDALDKPGPVREQPRFMGGGTFGFRTPAGAIVRVMPCGGDSRVEPTARIQLEKRKSDTTPFSRLVLCVDADVPAGHEVATLDHVGQLVKQHDPAAVATGIGFALEGGALQVAILQWQSDCAPATRGVPEQQTLERVVCSALAVVWPDRADAVQTWLDSRPGGVDSVKAASWSFMAGWFPDHGSEAFLKNIWGVPAVANELERQLALLPAWGLIDGIFAEG